MNDGQVIFGFTVLGMQFVPLEEYSAVHSAGRVLLSRLYRSSTCPVCRENTDHERDDDVSDESVEVIPVPVHAFDCPVDALEALLDQRPSNQQWASHRKGTCDQDLCPYGDHSLNGGS